MFDVTQVKVVSSSLQVILNFNSRVTECYLKFYEKTTHREFFNRLEFAIIRPKGNN